jgi:hypothetical protein
MSSEEGSSWVACLHSKCEAVALDDLDLDCSHGALIPGTSITDCVSYAKQRIRSGQKRMRKIWTAAG